MTDEANLIVNTLRECAVATPCSKCVLFCGSDECFFTATAKVIESLAAELEQVKQERDGLNILLGQAQSMLETRTRERDTAIAIIAGTPSCETCAHYTPGYFCPGCRNKSNWQFCGVKR